MNKSKALKTSEINNRNTMNFISLIGLYFKKIFSDWRVWTMAIFMLVCFLCVVSVLYSYKKSGGLMSLMISITVIFSLGITSNDIRTSTVFKNLKLVGTTKSKYYLSQLLFSLAITLIYSFTYWIIIAIIGNFNFFIMDGGMFKVTYGKFNPFAYHQWVFILYITLVSGLVSFSLYFLISQISRNNKTYFLIVIALFIFSIIFGGGIINSYYSISWDTTDFWIKADATMIPNHFLTPTLLLSPLFGVGQFHSMITQAHRVVSQKNEIIYNADLKEWASLYFTVSPTSNFDSIEKFNRIFTIWQPYYVVAVCGIVGVVISKIRGSE